VCAACNVNVHLPGAAAPASVLKLSPTSVDAILGCDMATGSRVRSKTQKTAKNGERQQNTAKDVILIYPYTSPQNIS